MLPESARAVCRVRGGARSGARSHMRSADPLCAHLDWLAQYRGVFGCRRARQDNDPRSSGATRLWRHELGARLNPH